MQSHHPLIPAASVAVPASVYNNVQNGDVVTIKVTNSDGGTSNSLTTTVLALPSGGTITESGGYRIHTFTSSGNFVNTLSNLSVQYLVIAGGGGGIPSYNDKDGILHGLDGVIDKDLSLIHI